MTKLKMFDSVSLLRDLPEFRLRAGDTGVVVEVYRDDVAFEVEFMDSEGDTVALLTIERPDLRRTTVKEQKDPQLPERLTPGVDSVIGDASRTARGK